VVLAPLAGAGGLPADIAIVLTPLVTNPNLLKKEIEDRRRISIYKKQNPIPQNTSYAGKN
jgi:hypothetical protein